MESGIKSYFENLFTHGSTVINGVIDVIEIKILKKPNELLVAHFFADYVTKAVFSTHQDKSLIEDGFSSAFSNDSGR